MKRVSAIWSCVAAVIIGGVGNVTEAQQQARHDHAGHNHANHSHSGETLAYRLPQWKELHFDDAQKAQQHMQAVQKLGCDARQGAHAGHIDVTYRCPEWKSIDVVNHELAHQWEGWLKGAGFDVSHGHIDPKFTQGPEAVEFRLAEWKVVHGGQRPEEVTKTISTLRSIGCEVSEEQHAGHSDVKYRSPVWQDIHVPDHQSAQQWQSWLAAQGFETSHAH
jgi:hypothetical protein